MLRVQTALLRMDAEDRLHETRTDLETRLAGRRADLEARLEEKLERWVYLNDLAERIAGQ